ncbi:GSCOCG00006284001-RA-CDS [Cotesia congregata]|nr:GSCOCG00006284001-RA-CDS [Cotesia congregata]
MPSLCYILFPIIVIMGLLRKCRERTWGRCKDTSSLQGKVFLVTGANSGIGKETVRELARRQARVILACRDMDNARNAISEIRKDVSTGEMIPMELDLASLVSIRKFAQQVLNDFPEIHCLINNAGVYVPLKNSSMTRDGFEIHFGVNHLGHFLLTNLLLDRLKVSAPSRVVIVTSKLLSGVIDFSNLNGEKGLPAKGRMNPGYVNSKLANVYFGKELAKRLQDSGVNVYMVFALLFLRTAHQGAQTVLHCATDASLSEESGLIYRDCKTYDSKVEFKDDVAENLWAVSASLVGVNTIK